MANSPRGYRPQPGSYGLGSINHRKRCHKGGQMKYDPWLEVKIDRLKKQLSKAKGRNDTLVVQQLSKEIHELWTRLMAMVPKQ
jgi:hypothetical protein